MMPVYLETFSPNAKPQLFQSTSPKPPSRPAKRTTIEKLASLRRTNGFHLKRPRSCPKDQRLKLPPGHRTRRSRKGDVRESIRWWGWVYQLSSMYMTSSFQDEKLIRKTFPKILHIYTYKLVLVKVLSCDYTRWKFQTIRLPQHLLSSSSLHHFHFPHGEKVTFQLTHFQVGIPKEATNCKECTPWKFNIAPENGWLEDEFPFGIPYFQGLC